MKISSKLVTAFAGILLLPSIAIAGFAYNSARSGVNTQMLNTATSNVNLLNSQIDSYISTHEEDVDTLTSQVDKSNNDPATIQDLLDAFQSKHPELEGSWIVPMAGGYFHAPHMKMPKNFNPKVRPWYIAAKNTPGHPIVTAPYSSAVVSGTEVVALAEMSPDGKYIIGTNLSLESLASIAKHVKIGQSGYAVLADNQKHYIVDPSHKAGSPVGNAHEWAVIYSQASGDVKYTLNGQSNQSVFETNKLTGWKVIGTMDLRDEATASAPILHETIIVLVIALLLGALCVFFVIRSIITPLKSLVRSAKTIGDGNLTEEILIKNKDEFGQLGNSFNQMRESIRGVLVDVSQTSEQVAASAEELMASSEQSGKAAQNISEIIQVVANGSERQAARVDESNVVVREMSGGIQQIAVSAQRVTENSSDATAVADEGQVSIESVVTHMDHIHNTVTGLAESVQKLGERSQQIGNIVNVITDIASQTNLLSLNASIEAARAGEQGRGFAVVANEIRKLAEQSASSAQGIAELVTSIQMDTNEAVKATSSTSEAVVQGLNAVQFAGKSFTKIHGTVTAVADQIQEVSAAVEQMSASSEEVSRSMSAIYEVTQETAAGTQNVSAATEEQLASMEEITASATELARMAEELQHMIQRFTV
ncbi:methyl-accepting chemotaxis protein [Alicyclobacillus dauci]|uniref:Methyl-accepting chemotaxis protein n=1 Tax=Alicyclobacillus dauci TaxID=1475485 RepID=A0ABY6Z178_9BACL|nr:methyl-accepting chemotaxis protein [Alicyclobacillus dauci]WAH36328.1 methyl-accepting chemotaxis protein [Alicyclobacillus dauci]